MLKEWNQCRSDRNHLLWRHIHEVNICRWLHGELIHVANVNQLINELILIVQLSRRLCNHVIRFVNRRQVLDLVGDDTVDHLPVRRLEEAVLVSSSVSSQRVDQTDVRSFRRLNRADSTVVGWMHVAHLKSSTLTRQTAWAQC